MTVRLDQCWPTCAARAQLAVIPIGGRGTTATLSGDTAVEARRFALALARGPQHAIGTQCSVTVWCELAPMHNFAIRHIIHTAPGRWTDSGWRVWQNGRFIGSAIDHLEDTEP